MIFVKSMDNPHCAAAFFYENNKWKEIKKDLEKWGSASLKKIEMITFLLYNK